MSSETYNPYQGRDNSQPSTEITPEIAAAIADAKANENNFLPNTKFDFHGELCLAPALRHLISLGSNDRSENFLRKFFARTFCLR